MPEATGAYPSILDLCAARGSDQRFVHSTSGTSSRTRIDTTTLMLTSVTSRCRASVCTGRLVGDPFWPPPLLFLPSNSSA